jgi:hypothetical protein
VQLVEHARVLDGDDSLIGEGRRQLDLLVSERPHRVSDKRDNANRRSFSQERDTKHGATNFFLPSPVRPFGIS